MSHYEDYQPERLFTLEEANAMLPLVRAITQDLSELATDVVERQRRLAFLVTQRQESGGQDVYSEELTHVHEELEKDKFRLREFVEELQQLGVECKGATEGLVDFPAEMDGRLVLLCWKLGEPEVMHWHDLEGGFAGRQPLPALASSSHGGNS